MSIENSPIIDPTSYKPKDWYRGVQGLKKDGVQIKYSKEMQFEILRCKKDLEYFAENYVWITDIDKGLIKFKPRDYQKKFWKVIQNNRFSISKQGRQAGKCDAFVNKIKVKSPEGKIIETQIGVFYEWIRFREEFKNG